MNKKQKLMLKRIIIASLLLIALQFVPITGVLQLICFLAIYGIIGYDILWKSWKGIRNKQVFDENFLMAVATIGVFALAIYEQSGDYNEAIAVMLFYQIGELFQYIQPAYQKYVFHGSKDAKFALATLGNDAGIFGAAKLVLE